MASYQGVKLDVEILFKVGATYTELNLVPPEIPYPGRVLKFGEEPVPSTKYKAEGVVTERSLPVVRTLRLYRKSTGELIDETLSLVDGSYELRTPYNDTHYIVCMDDDAGEEYNHLITKEANLVRL